MMQVLEGLEGMMAVMTIDMLRMHGELVILGFADCHGQEAFCDLHDAWANLSLFPRVYSAKLFWVYGV
jgi:hypothetical protein